MRQKSSPNTTLAKKKKSNTDSNSLRQVLMRVPKRNIQMAEVPSNIKPNHMDIYCKSDLKTKHE